jgi:2-hydroxy-3-keto-5-methylthiopentenyl-1-phosphate phosphatase
MARLGLDLSTTSVFLDFDGTISTVDVGRHLLARSAPPAWWDLHEQYDRGEIGSRECIARQWALAEGTEVELRAIAAEVPLDPGFERLVRVLRDGRAELTVVSDGFGFYVEDVCERLGLDAFTNAVDFEPRGIRFPHEDPDCTCAACGVCKPAPIGRARARGKTTVLVGDGASDRHAALVADLVFAKDELADWCETAGVAFTPFDCLDDVRGALEPS